MEKEEALSNLELFTLAHDEKPGGNLKPLLQTSDLGINPQVTTSEVMLWTCYTRCENLSDWISQTGPRNTTDSSSSYPGNETYHPEQIHNKKSKEYRLDISPCTVNRIKRTLQPMTSGIMATEI